MTNREFQLVQYIIRLRGIVLHYASPSAIDAAHGLLAAIDATLENRDHDLRLVNAKEDK